MEILPPTPWIVFFSFVLVLSMCILLSILRPLCSRIGPGSMSIFRSTRENYFLSLPPFIFHDVYKSRIRKKHMWERERERESWAHERHLTFLITSRSRILAEIQPTNQSIDRSSLHKKGCRCLEVERGGERAGPRRVGAYRRLTSRPPLSKVCG
jgi:hypothetical protein